MKTNKKNRIISALISAFICLPIIFSSISPLISFADSETVYIESKEDFIEFAKNCSSDGYSKNRSFVLKADIDLTDIDFSPVPIFCGSFDGNGHTISSIFEGALSPIGLFSRVTEGATIKNLKVHARFAPSGDADTVGGIVGINEGVIENCSFTGSIIGGFDVGGIAGINKTSGSIISCSAYGEFLGEGRVGGIAGTSLGLISDCTNEANVNTVCITPSMSLDEINLSLTIDISSLPSLNSLTTMDIGGIAGYLGGFILGCSNSGNIGYPHVGYNIGGIAGRSTGHIASSSNLGVINGRRDVGGIVGQMEPYVEYNISEDLLISLKTELDKLSSVVSEALKKETDGNSGITHKLDSLLSLLDSATSSVEGMLRGGLDYADGLTTEINRLFDVLSAVMTRFAEITDDLPEISKHLTNGLQDISDALEKLGQSISLGANALSDMSDAMSDFSLAFEVINGASAKIEAGLTGLQNAVKITDYGKAEESIDKISQGIDEMISAFTGFTDSIELFIGHFENVGWMDRIAENIKNTEKIFSDIISALVSIKSETDKLGNDIESGMALFSEDIDAFEESINSLISAIIEIDENDIAGVKDAIGRTVSGIKLMMDAITLDNPLLVKDAAVEILESLSMLNEICYDSVMGLINIGENLESFYPTLGDISSGAEIIINSGNEIITILPDINEDLVFILQNISYDYKDTISGGMIIIDGRLDFTKELIEFDASTEILKESLENIEKSIKHLAEAAKNRDTTKIKDALDNIGSAFENMSQAIKSLPEQIIQISEILYEAKIWGDQLVGYAGDIAGAVGEMGDGLNTLWQGVSSLRDSVDIDLKGSSESISLLISGLTQMMGAGENVQNGLDHMTDAFDNLEGATSYIASIFVDIVFAMIDISKAANLITSTLGEVDSLMQYLKGIDPIQLPTPSDSIKKDANKLFITIGKIEDTVNDLFDDVSSMTSEMAESAENILQIFTKASDGIIDLIYGMQNGDILYGDVGRDEINSLTNGRVFDCLNKGQIKGDLNVGGIAGIIGFEGSDPEGDSSEELSAMQKSHYRVKAVIDSSKNLGKVTAKRNNAGGILGNADFGVVYGCEAYCSVSSEAGGYVGGIVGGGAVAIKECFAKASLSGGKYIGGIIGSGVSENTLGGSSLVEGCYSMIVIENFSQYAGAVAGVSLGDFKNNFFVSDTLAGIDRVSYDGKTNRITYEDLSKKRSLPEEFCRFVLSFVADGVLLYEEYFDYRASFESSIFPEIPRVDGHYGVWDKTDLTNLTFDTVVSVIYTPYTASVVSEEKRENGKHIFIAEGSFTEGDMLNIQPNADLAGLHYSQGFFLKSYIGESYIIDLSGNHSDSAKIHFLPENSRARIYVRLDGEWQQVEAEEFGSYLLFSLNGETAEIAVIYRDIRILPIAIIAGVLLSVISTAVIISVRKKKNEKDK